MTAPGAAEGAPEAALRGFGGGVTMTGSERIFWRNNVDIVTYPDPCLLKEAADLEDMDDETRRLASEMLESMYRGRGIGLAAPQVGISSKLIVVNLAASSEEGEEIVLANPVVIEQDSETEEQEEGCLSLPGITGTVPRWRAVAVEGIDLEGRERRIEAEGLFARVLQHEIDHLEGVLFYTKVSPVDRAAIKPKLKELKEKVR